MILLFSGGIDSFVAYHFLKKPPTVYFDLNSRYTEKEKRIVKELIPTTLIDSALSIGDREVGEKAYVPFRNLLLAALAVKYSDTIIIAGVKDDVVSDKNEQIFEKISTLLSEMEGRSIKVISPFWQMTKAQVVRWYLENSGESLDLLATVSCYSSEPTNYCGACPSCFRKWIALRSNGIDIHFINLQLMQEYYEAAKSGKYISERNEGIIREIDAYCS